VRGHLSQALLDNLAIAWSRLDDARPREPADVPTLLIALDEWVRWAVRIDVELLAALGDEYATSRAARPGGRPLPGLHLAAALSERTGHAIDTLVTVSAGSPAVFYDAVWRRYEELPAAEPGTERVEAYRLHLAGQAARRPASAVTTFLLRAAVAGAAGR
jgi:hypothetical protein